ncbi:MAG: family 43 glycosylhydrolase, partial [Bifidobacteriaceae bacterium]|nr:family 43 glycosylhydrolase [Bifidobacteriaceae bacterium]
FYAAPNTTTQTYPREKYLGFMDTVSGVTVERYYNTSSRITTGNASATFADTGWKHVDLVLTASATKLYIEGKLVGQNSGTVQQLTTILGTSGGIIQLGKANWESGEYYSGLLDNLQIRSRALTDQEIADANLARDIEALTLGDTSGLTANLSLPTSSIFGSSVTWATSDAGVITAGGQVSRPAAGEAAATATLTATLTSDAGSGTKQFPVTVLAWTDTSAEDLAAIVIPEADDVRTNITLPTQVGDTQVTWTAKPSGIVSTTQQGDKKPGVVTRPATDTKVTLTAKAPSGATRQIVLTVKAAPANLESTMGVRDPHLVRSVEGDKYWVIGTDLHAEGTATSPPKTWDQVNASQKIVVWQSNDLVNWTSQRTVFAGFDYAGCVWAPEAWYDEKTGEYLVYWAARDQRDNGTNSWALRMYLVRTRDFYTFTEPEVWVDLNDYTSSSDGPNAIDATLAYEAGIYYRFVTSDWRTVVDTATSLDGPWTRVIDRGQESAHGLSSSIEGLTVYQLPDGTWTVMGDNSGYKAFSGGSVLASLNFTALTSGSGANQYSFDQRFRHGSVLRLSKTEEAAVLAAYGSGDTQAVAAAWGKLKVTNSEAAYGNLYLPTEIDGVTITWTSSNPAVVSATGEVVRQAADADVVLTATLTKGTAQDTKTIPVHVKAAIELDPFQAYMFAYFTGDTAAGENIFFAASNGNTALSWTELNGGAAKFTSKYGEEGLRDPFIIRSPEGDTFYMIATDLSIGKIGNWDRSQRTGSRYIEVWESHDLVTWSEQRHVLVSPETAGNTWAPEAYYDDSIGAYVVFWASKIYSSTDTNHTGSAYQHMMYATTRDFVTFSEPQVWQDTGLSRIDSTVIKADGVYYRVTKDEAQSMGCGADVFQESSTNLRAPVSGWTMNKQCIGQSAGVSGVEGPTIFKANPGDASGYQYYLFVDQYSGSKYTPLVTNDIANAAWVKPASYSLPSSPRHGTVMPITAAELTALTSVPPVQANAAGEVLRYDFENGSGTTVVDVSGNGQDGTIVNGAVWGDGELTFDGSNDYVKIPDNILAGLTDITIEAEVWIDGTLTSPYFIYGLGNTSGTSGNGYIFTTGDATYRTSIATGNYTTEQTANSGAALAKGEWVSLTYTLKGNQATLYLNGLAVATATVTIEPGDIGDGATLANYLGRSLYSADKYFKGKFREFAIYNRALTEKEVKEHNGIEPEVVPSDPDEPYGYLIAHFIEDSAGYAEKIYFDISNGDDPTSWTKLNGGQPILVNGLNSTGVRDPYLVKNPQTGKYYILGTDLRVFGCVPYESYNCSNGAWGATADQLSPYLVIWESDDLVTWSDPWLMKVAQPDHRMAWAPEATWVADRGEFILYWSSYSRSAGYTQVQYGFTADFTTAGFTYGGTLIDLGHDVIDTTVHQYNGKTYRISKDNGAGRNAVYMEVTDAVEWWLPATTWTQVRDGIGQADYGSVEGPLIFKAHDAEEWYVFVDQYGSSGQGYRPYKVTGLGGPVATAATDIQFTKLAAPMPGMDSATKHGVVIGLTAGEYTALRRADQVESVSSVAVSTPAGVAPVLPSTVTVTYADDTYGPLTEAKAVTWQTVQSSQYASQGVFTVSGQVTGVLPNGQLSAYVGSTLKATATVTVTAPLVDKTALEAAIDAAESLDEAEYTAASWAPVAAALDEAQDVFDNPLATQDEVDQAAQALVDAIAGLQPLGQKEVLESWSDIGQALVDSGVLDVFTDESVQDLLDALEAAQEVLDDPQASQAEVDQA